ncbi:MAG: hypothetical protein M3Y60_09935, partial [Bacteroidota bacterium]|nr:hypothetical protein [Bacteroidota bacterium]
PSRPDYTLVGEFMTRAAFHFEDCLTAIDTILIQRRIEDNVLDLANSFAFLQVCGYGVIEVTLFVVCGSVRGTGCEKSTNDQN